MSEAQVALPNDPAARTETGEIKDAATALLDQPKPTTETTTEPTPEPKTTDESKVEPNPEAPPEKYEFKAPEGFMLDEKFIEDVTPVLKELGINQAGADKLFEKYVGKLQATVEAPLKAFEEMRTGWRNDILKDPALGDGNDLKPEIKATIGRAIDSMGPKLATEFREAMALTGAADNPAVFRGLLALAQLSTEGRPVKGAGPSPAGQGNSARPASPAKALYPNLP